MLDSMIEQLSDQPPIFETILMNIKKSDVLKAFPIFFNPNIAGAPRLRRS